MNKFGARKSYVNGFRFDSKKEAEYYLVLMAKQKQGQISDLKIHPKYDFHIHGKVLRYPKSKRPVIYEADFEFEENGERVIVDVKGYDTPLSKLKRALFTHLEGREVVLV